MKAENLTIKQILMYCRKRMNETCATCKLHALCFNPTFELLDNDEVDELLMQDVEIDKKGEIK